MHEGEELQEEKAVATTQPEQSTSTEEKKKTGKYCNKSYNEREDDLEPLDITVQQMAHRLLMTDIDHFSMYCAAPRRSGKTYLLLHLLYWLDTYARQKRGGPGYDCVLLFSGTSFKLQFPMISRLYQYDDWSDKEALIVDALLDRQQEIIEHNSQCTVESEKRPVPNVLIILDDVLGQAGNLYQGKRSRTLQALFFRGRHLNISQVIILQLLKGFSRVRSNSDMIVVWRSPSHIERKDLIDAHLTAESSNPESRRAAERFYEKCFQSKHHCSVIDIAGSHGRKNIQQYCYSCVAPDFEMEMDEEGHPPFGMGPEHTWVASKT